VRKKKKIKSDIYIDIAEESSDTEALGSQVFKIPDPSDKDENPIDQYACTILDPDQEEEDKEWEGTHPAEIAARFMENDEETHKRSDDQILKDLRKAVFQIPLLHQNEVNGYITRIDNVLKPIVYDILFTCRGSLEDVVQIIVKVAAGNTYGKNIYEKKATVEKSKTRITYKPHELDFLINAYPLLKIHADISEGKPHSFEDLRDCFERCSFIRGVHEEILSEFLAKMKHYEDLQWEALKYKISKDYDKYYQKITLIENIEVDLKVSKNIFGIYRRAVVANDEFLSLRSKVIAPYLRSAYSIARSTAKNAHQMLDNFQNGSLGLIRAVSCYSINRQASFSAVARAWIKQMMLLMIKEDSNFVKLPVSVWQSYTQLEKVKNKMGIEDLEKLSKEVNITVAKIKAIYDTVKLAQVYSLNRTYDLDERLTLEDIISDESKQEESIEDILRDYCSKADLDTLELKIVALRFGMSDIIKPKKVNPQVKIKEAIGQYLNSIGFNFELT